jgi:hypothetical protein
MSDTGYNEVSMPVMPTGYVYHAQTIDRAESQLGASAATASVPGITGATKAMIGRGIHYWNLTAFLADLLKRQTIVMSQRKLIDCGPDGKVLEPLGQQTGICDGCSFGEAALIAWAARYVAAGLGPIPRECSFLWPYLAGRDLSVISGGDSGALPALSALLYHDVGALPVDECGLQDLPPHGPKSQESLCVQMRDNPRLRQEWVDRAARFKAAVYVPRDPWEVGDCLSTLRPVTFGGSYQARESVPGGNGVSSLYQLRDGWGRPAGHETFASGWFTLRGRLGFIKTESWWNAAYPASKWPGGRVQIQTDDGPKMLYPGQCAIWADEWMSGRPECWAVDAPGSRA